MPEIERFTLTVVDGLAIERAALLALLADALPQFATAESSGDAATPASDTIALLDLDRVAPGDLTRTLAEAAARYRGLVALSASSALESVRAVLRSERSAFVWKGDDPGELVAAVVSVASGRTWISETARRAFLAAGADRRPVLSPQESRVMRSYGSGTAVKTVAVEMRIAEHTVRTYIKRIKTKYLEAGVPLESRVDFYRHLDGHDVARRNGGDRVRSGAQEVGRRLDGDPAA
ncbi:DNA-binding response regulator, NarL/FixJ family, contains REC and HTH domains [Rathayibacter oskolensis]|uniref:DNA-binding response regulator, NarL/FixJ family, contains REC and HTH domains n=1 Tax=Rathayibacter oskolensis TaxID=1891671 RepID=A0A1X7N311_9MICO|nr:LuxR C-terminal-related transcriptional regulator [Rathayibacter oskolensis]SMH30823.1 DNA-binding response regulator, NarL/FixJ family, contains REC and HTH domains [Rathayibacter oskolensis]